MKKTLSFLLHVLIGFVVCFVFFAIAVLLIFQRNIPRPLLERALAYADMEDYALQIKRATYSPGGGLSVYGVELLPKHSTDDGLITAESIHIEFSPSPFVPLRKRLRKVTVVRPFFPYLPPKSGKEVTPVPPPPDLPRIDPFELEVKDPDILGIHARRLTALASMRGHNLSFRAINILWPDKALRVDASLVLDLETRILETKINGHVYPSNILPLMLPRRVNSSVVLREAEKFQEIREPVRAEADLSIHIDTADFDLKLALDVPPCTYNGVPLESIKGNLEACETNITTTVRLSPIEARGRGGELYGRLTYCDGDNQVIFTSKTAMDLPNLFDIIGVLNEGELSVVNCAIPPRVEASGIVSVSKTMEGATNNATGKVTLEKGSILNFNVVNTTADFQLTGFSILFNNLSGRAAHGGDLRGWINFDFPDYDATRTVFHSELNFKNIDMLDVLHAVNVTNTQMGKLTGKMRLNSTTGTNALERLCGSGHIDFSHGVITQIPLFAGFTAYLARNVPGISSLVDQSSGSMDFTITNGVLHTENAFIEGSVFSIKAHGTYDIAHDRLDFVARANIFKNKSIVGKITHIVTFPFTKLLLEFKVFGPLEKTDWSYVSILERISDTSTSLFGRKKEKEEK